jgi:hypothetical protein
MPDYPAMVSKELETLWRSRLREAHLRLDFIRHLLRGVQRDGCDGHRRAIRLEHLAQQEYRHLQQILFDLTVREKAPDEEEWQRRTAPGAGLM